MKEKKRAKEEKAKEKSNSTLPRVGILSSEQSFELKIVNKYNRLKLDTTMTTPEDH